MERYFHDEAFAAAAADEGFVQPGLTKLEYAALLMAVHDPDRTSHGCVKRAVEVLDEVNRLRERAVKEDLCRDQGRSR